MQTITEQRAHGLVSENPFLESSRPSDSHTLFLKSTHQPDIKRPLSKNTHPPDSNNPSFDSSHPTNSENPSVQSSHPSDSGKLSINNSHPPDIKRPFSENNHPSDSTNPSPQSSHQPDSHIPSPTNPLRTAPFTYKYPLGLIAWFWLQYYYPIFAHPQFIPQKNGETDRLEAGKTLAIRTSFRPVIEFYASRGGFPQLHYDLLRDAVPVPIRRDVLLLFRKLCETIVRMPMQHMGFSMFGEPFSLVNARRGSVRGLSYGALLREAGELFVHPELHEVIDALGGLLVGDDSIVSGWASFTQALARRSEGDSLVSEADVLAVLRSNPLGERDVLLARRVLGRESRLCVWSGRAADSTHVDHVLPFSLTRNNGLWNLVPVAPAVNLKKSDRIPAPELVGRSADRIASVWRLFEANYEALFWQEVYEGLGVAREAGVDGALRALQGRCSYLIGTRGLEAFRG